MPGSFSVYTFGLRHSVVMIFNQVIILLPNTRFGTYSILVKQVKKKAEPSVPTANCPTIYVS